MSHENRLKFDNPGLFIPTVVRGVVDSGSPTGFLDFSSVSDRNIGTTSSFRYDVPGAGLRSTQQILVDFSKFENHTFFQSAQVAVHLSFDKIINHYPFDGTRKEIEEFLDSLTGFEKYVYDQFPKQRNFLFFSGVLGSPANITGTYIEIQDFAGSVFPTISTKRSGESIIDPGLDSITFEMQLYLPGQTNNVQTVFQKISGTNQGLSLFVSQSVSSATAQLYFTAVSGSSFLNVSASVTKSEFNHIVATFNRKPGINKLQLYVDEVLIEESANSISFGEIDFTVSPLFIGSGSSVQTNINGTQFIPIETLSGALDEFRIFHTVRTIEQQEAFAKKSIFPDETLKLYFKFNEPVGVLGLSSGSDTNRVVIDSSGNSLHSLICSGGFNFDLRISGSVNNPMTYEKDYYSPILFPNFSEIIDLNSSLLNSATLYDENNPNLITRLVPPHYLLEGQAEEAFDTVEGTITNIYSGTSIPGSGELGQTQIMQSMLYIWAKFFDDLKMYIDVFSKVLHVGYDTEASGSVPDQFLPQLGEYLGVSLPSLFTDASVEQFIDAENLDYIVSTSQINLQSIQNKIWRRLLTNIRDIISSKGTLHSVKAFIRTLGIDPDSNFRIREYGGRTKRNLANQYEIKTEVSTMLSFTGSNSFIKSPFLRSAHSSEPGYPGHAISSPQLTSGSWTYEAIYRFPLNPVTGALTSHSQSLARFMVTGTTSPLDTGALVLNVISVSSSNKVELWARPTFATSSADIQLNMYLTGVNIFDGNKWNISFGRFRNDDPSEYLFSGSFKSNVSSSYFLRAARSDRGKIKEKFVTQSFYQEDRLGNLNNIVWQSTGSFNISGTFFAIGSQSLGDSSLYLHTSSISNQSRITTFGGRISQIRFWSRGLLENEWEEHVKNFKSIGVNNPLVGFNFVSTESGSWGKLRIDASTDQQITASNSSGELSIFDFSQNNFHLSGTGFESNTIISRPETFYYGFISPKFDQASTTDKVRVRGFLDYERSLLNQTNYGPVFELDPNEAPLDDIRFSIDFSIIDSLDQDIVNLFATFDEIDKLVGAPENLYSYDYVGLEKLREIYFNRLNDKINLKSFFEFFKWFDRSIGHFIEALIPRKTKFRGINYVIESHMLERAKYQHQNVDMYLDVGERNSLKGVIILGQLLGTTNKY